MLINSMNSIDNLCNLEQPFVSERSILHHFQPIGINTALLESLTSYITRLALSHSIFPGVLMERIIAPLIHKKYGAANLHRIYGFTEALNGTGVMASDLVQTLQRLTLRYGLVLSDNVNLV